jgi:hypothetical protein
MEAVFSKAPGLDGQHPTSDPLPPALPRLGHESRTARRFVDQSAERAALRKVKSKEGAKCAR